LPSEAVAHKFLALLFKRILKVTKNGQNFFLLGSKYLLLFGFFLFQLFASGQVFFSNNPKYLRSKTEQNNLITNFKYNYPDTSVFFLTDYFPRNFMGNAGMPSPEYIIKYGTEDIGFRFFNPPLTNDRFSSKEIPYYRSVGPFARLTGIAGSKELQIFDMMFTHTYKDKLNITVGFRRYTSKGFYRRQQTYTNNLYLSSNYETRSRRAGYYLFVLNNSNKGNESGGLVKERLSDTSVLQLKELLEVRVQHANRDNRETQVMINPYFRLNKRSDSTHNLNHYVQLKSKFSDRSFQYKDNGIGSDKFYNVAYLDTNVTHDSSHVRQYINSLDYAMISRTGNAGLSIGYRNEINQVWQYYDSTIVNHLAQADFMHRFKLNEEDTSATGRFAEAKFNSQYVINGPNVGNFKAETNILLSFNERKKRRVYFDLLWESRNADQMARNWYSNHFVWTGRSRSPVEQFQARLGATLGPLIKVQLTQQNITHYVYFDQLAMPQQYMGTITNNAIELQVGRVFAKHLGLYLDHIYQSSSKASIVRLPGNVTTARLYYTGNIARNNLQLQIGTQVQVYESFTPYAYMPATQSFYLQNSVKTASYPFVDIYLSARIRPVSFFLKVENVAQGLVGNDYYLVEGYYQPDRAFRFGLTWMFFD
jgi:hypothetical protein